MFYVDSKDKAEQLKQVFDQGYLKTYHKTIIDGHISNEQESIIHVLGYDCKLLINNPETWRLYVLYEDVPFTQRDLLRSEEQVDLDLAGSMESNDELAFVLPSLPINTFESAKKLENELIEKNIDVHNYYSSGLADYSLLK